MQRYTGRAISKAVWGLVIVAVLVVAGGAYFLSTSTRPPTGTPAAVEVDINIIEDDPVNQLDHFYPDNATVKLGQNVTIAVSNGDDELRHFVITQFNINLTMPPGTAARGTFTANALGTFTFISPATPPIAISKGKPGPMLTGTLTVSP